MPKSTFTGRYLTDDERARLLSINPRYDVDRHLNRALTFGLYSLLRISQVFNANWDQFRAPDQLWVPGIKGQEGRWIRLHPKALAVMGPPRPSGQIFDRWLTLEAFRESVKKKAAREKLRGVRFHETKHTGISALLEAGYSIPEVCRISANSMRTIAHYAHVNEQRVFEKWKSFEYGGQVRRSKSMQPLYSRNRRNRGQIGSQSFPRGIKAKMQIVSSSRQVLDVQTVENLPRGGAAW
jgi:integrase